MAKSAAKQETQVTPIADAKPKKKSWLLKIVIALVVLAGGGAAAWVAMEKPATTQDAAAPQEKPPVFVTLESFTVNLQPQNGDQYLQVGLVLKVAEAATADAVKLQMPEIRNRILLLLTSKKASEISTVEGKQRLSTEIKDEARQSLVSQKTQQGIISVFFTSFVIQ
ncbi:MAG: flagellar basal body-associated protein FliL [Betaproteobacteria bacterium]|nr:flagellar basal body-associated protein FliL [Betaproteobacteria bacterium]MBI2289447.1 flagellar basal body-associated protein FliL [Betaproteobacteria bacterium]MBI3053673.1 flagellar basal body-associated protein FliL [Betaproteobacteria bacterium]